MKLYHYRSIESACLEIENGTFYFASKEELNDPLEGYIRVCWKGDQAAWEGLLRNYICSVHQAIELYVLRADSRMLHQSTIVLDIHSHDDVPLGARWQEIGDMFLENERVQSVISYYGKKERKIYQQELTFILRMLHSLVVSICLKSDVDAGCMDPEQVKVYLGNLKDTKQHKISFRELEEKGISDRDRMALMKVSEYVYRDLLEQSILCLAEQDTFLYDGSEDHQITGEAEKRARQHRNWLSIIVEYPDIYVEQLKEMIYPEGFMVCFSEQSDNSVMWGNYADNHKGVCLIYGTDENDRMGICTDGRQSRKAPNWEYTGWSSWPVRRVDYGGERLERNFFETFGRLTIGQVRSWLTGTEGVSRYLECFTDQDAWREKYWSAFEAKNYRKLPEWSYEKEYRLVIDNMLMEYSTPDTRVLSVDPHMLKGVIFGIRTTEYDKKRIMDALKQGGYDKLSFFQAEYDEEQQKLQIRKKRIGYEKTNKTV